MRHRTRHSRHSRKGGSSYMSRLMRRTRNTFRTIKHHARPHIKHVMPFLRRTARRFGLGHHRRMSRRKSFRRKSFRRGMGSRRHGGSTYNQRLNRRVKNSFSKIYDNVKPYVKKYAPRIVEALAKRAGVGSRRNHMTRRKSRRCGCSLYGGALNVAGYGKSRSRRGRGMTRRRRRS
jgi:hypothetical protein